MFGGFAYRLLYAVIRAVLFLYHPVFRVIGKENVPMGGRLLICPNHRGMADPLWILFALGFDHVPRIMAKKEVMKVPVLGRFLQRLGVFGVDRGGNDVNAIKTGLRCLKEDHQLLIFPEGSRVKPGKHLAPKRGVMVLSHRTDTPILPVYISTKRYPFSPMTCVIGKPYKPEYPNDRPTDAQLEQQAQELMDRIYEMGERT